METTSTNPVGSDAGDEPELVVEVSPPVAVAITLLAAAIAATLAIAIAAGWNPF
jgi:hypothetical protein